MTPETPAATPPPATEINPALILFAGMHAALQEVELPEVWHSQLTARLNAMKPELPSDDFARLCALLKANSMAAARLQEMEAEINALLLDLITDKLAEYSALQILLDESEHNAECVARLHPEWFDQAKVKTRTVNTPYGSAKMHASSALKIEDEAKSLELLKSLRIQEAIAHSLSRPFDAAQFRRESVALNLEALEVLADDVLAKLKIARVTKDNFTIKPASISLKNGVKAVSKRDKAAKKESEAAV